MKQQLRWAVLTLWLAAMLAPAASFATNASPTGGNAGAPAQNPPPNAVPAQERHPVMHKALNQLQRVKAELQNDAARDFNGHRANAVKLIEEAIEQLQQGIQADKY